MSAAVLYQTIVWGLTEAQNVCSIEDLWIGLRYYYNIGAHGSAMGPHIVYIVKSEVRGLADAQ